jgi:hypothetical protein
VRVPRPGCAPRAPPLPFGERGPGDFLVDPAHRRLPTPDSPFAIRYSHRRPPAADRPTRRVPPAVAAGANAGKRATAPATAATHGFSSFDLRHSFVNRHSAFGRRRRLVRVPRLARPAVPARRIPQIHGWASRPWHPIPDSRLAIRHSPGHGRHARPLVIRPSSFFGHSSFGIRYSAAAADSRLAVRHRRKSRVGPCPGVAPAWMSLDEPAGSSDLLNLPENERARAIGAPRCASLKNDTSRRRAWLYVKISTIDLGAKMYHRTRLTSERLPAGAGCSAESRTCTPSGTDVRR